MRPPPALVKRVLTTGSAATILTAVQTRLAGLKRGFLAITATTALVLVGGTAAHAGTTLCSDGDAIISNRVSHSSAGEVFSGKLIFVSGTGNRDRPPAGTKIDLTLEIKPYGPGTFISTKTDTKGDFRFSPVRLTIASLYNILAESPYLSETCSSNYSKLPQYAKASTRINTNSAYKPRREGSEVNFVGLPEYELATAGRRSAWGPMFAQDKIYIERLVGGRWTTITTLKAGYYRPSDTWERVDYRAAFPAKSTFRWVVAASANFKSSASKPFTL